MEYFKEWALSLEPGVYPINSLITMIKSDKELHQTYFDNYVFNTDKADKCEKELLLIDLNEIIPNSNYTFKKNCGCSKLIIGGNNGRI